MGRRLEKRTDDFVRGDEKPRGWQRDQKVSRVLADIDLSNEAKARDEEPQRAEVLHIGNRLPQKNNPKKPKQETKDNSVKLSKEEKPMYRSDPTPETAERKPLTKESEAEKRAGLEEKIENGFNESEKEFKDLLIDNYSKELQVAKNKIEKSGGVVDDRWASNFRLSYINSRMTWGMDKKKWGTNGPLAPEKAALLQKYLFSNCRWGFRRKKRKILE